MEGSIDANKVYRQHLLICAGTSCIAGGCREVRAAIEAGRTIVGNIFTETNRATPEAGVMPCPHRHRY